MIFNWFLESWYPGLFHFIPPFLSPQFILSPFLYQLNQENEVNTDSSSYWMESFHLCSEDHTQSRKWLTNTLCPLCLPQTYPLFTVSPQTYPVTPSDISCVHYVSTRHILFPPSPHQTYPQSTISSCAHEVTIRHIFYPL